MLQITPAMETEIQGFRGPIPPPGRCNSEPHISCRVVSSTRTFGDIFIREEEGMPRSAEFCLSGDSYWGRWRLVGELISGLSAT